MTEIDGRGKGTHIAKPNADVIHRPLTIGSPAVSLTPFKVFIFAFELF